MTKNNNKHNNWKSFESKNQEEKLYSSQSRRRIDFVPSKKSRGIALSCDLNSRSLSENVVSGIEKRKQIVKFDSRTKSDNALVQVNSDIGLFNPHIVTKYLAWKTMRKVGPGFFNDGKDFIYLFISNIMSNSNLWY